MKHTPGPWKLTKYDNRSDSGKGFMGKIETHEGYSIYSAFGFESLTGRDETEAYANAKLISAAPELLSSLKELFEVLEKHEPLWYLKGHHKRAIEAIKKATE